MPFWILQTPYFVFVAVSYMGCGYLVAFNDFSLVKREKEKEKEMICGGSKVGTKTCIYLTEGDITKLWHPMIKRKIKFASTALVCLLELAMCLIWVLVI